MAATISISLSKAQIDALVQDKINNSSIPTQPPSFPSAPSGFSNGQTYTNTTDGKLYVLLGGIWSEIDTKENITFQDLAGNTILTD